MHYPFKLYRTIEEYTSSTGSAKWKITSVECSAASLLCYRESEVKKNLQRLQWGWIMGNLVCVNGHHHLGCHILAGHFYLSFKEVKNCSQSGVCAENGQLSSKVQWLCFQHAEVMMMDIIRIGTLLLYRQQKWITLVLFALHLIEAALRMQSIKGGTKL